ncbi:hypothetical protein [Sphingobacterium paludis]|uniref:DUF4136 domain-containing protein n=1 Tax=Sphingobacterium paludis TaxID=1476465 RepID=A0A4R7CQ73_9SPHI|nr:hypothetical protein [Sphingobacterium paludis]TDS05551.1 hypothetical protein B0I21_1212 [Sphingobacterium paludis]
MKKIIISIFVLLLNLANSFAQQDILEHVNSYYMKPEGYLTDLNTIIALDNGIARQIYAPGYESVINKLSPNVAYFRTQYPSTGWNQPCLIEISWYPQSPQLSTTTIEQQTTKLFDALTVSEDLDTRVIRYIKNDAKHAGYMYNTKHHVIDFVILSLEKRELVRGTIKINPTSDQMRETFVNAFIDNLQFEPYSPTVANPEPPISSGVNSRKKR